MSRPLNDLGAVKGGKGRWFLLDVCKSNQPNNYAQHFSESIECHQHIQHGKKGKLEMLAI